MGLTEHEFWDMTPKAFFLKYEGLIELEQWRSRDAWERDRLFTTMLLNISGKSYKRSLKPEQVLRFNWDKKETTKPSDEKRDYWLKKFGVKDEKRG